MEMQVDVSEEMDPKFAGFIKKLRLGEGTALKLWNGGITSAPALASSDKDDVKSIVNDPVLINTILPALQKCAFQITMAASPEDCALQMLRQAAGQQHNQQDTLQSDTDTFDPTRINTPTNGNVSTNQPLYQATRIGGLQMNMSGPTRTAANGRTTDVQITGGVFTNTAINANQPVTFNNQGATFVSNYTEDQSAKKEVPSSMIKLKNGMTFSTSEMHIVGSSGDIEDFWLGDMELGPPPPTTSRGTSVDCYPLASGISKALVINNVDFSGSPRLGADIDAKNMISLLKKLKFEVTFVRNKGVNDMKQLFGEFASNCANAPMCLVYVGSHGERKNNEDHFLGTDHQRMKVEEMTGFFSTSNAPQLAGKPKLFFLQFCRINQTPPANSGIRSDALPFVEEFDDVIVKLDHMNIIESDANIELREQDVHHKGHAHADMLVSFATAPGNKAFRDTTKGSWYVTTFCKVVKENVYHEDIVSMLTKVNNLVMVNKDNENGEVAVQVAEFKSTLRKKLMFYP